jgi:hypothetical protein
MHRVKRLRLLIILMLICFAASPNNLRCASFSASNNLYVIRKIYLRKLSQDYGISTEVAAEDEQIRAYLKQVLTTFGFVVIDDETKAEATMTGEFGEWVTLDGPQPDPPRYSFAYKLTLANKQQVWRTSFNISGRENKDSVNQKGIQKVAENLFKAWRKSAKNAGLNVNDKVITN